MSRDHLPEDVKSLIRQTMSRFESLMTPSALFDDETQDAVFGAIDDIDADMRELSKVIHDHPELSFEEVKAHRHLTDALTKLGFTVTNPTSLPTAFVAAWSNGEGGRTFAFNAEYDSLPGVGHACGHNLIAIVAVAAAAGLKGAMKARNLPGTVKVIGSPAEETGGGKVILLNEGAYDGIDACAMAHPEGGVPDVTDDGNAFVGGPATLARAAFSVELFGKGAHAGAAPWLGVNALDAAVQGYTAVSMMRQQIEPTMRVHGVIKGSEGWVQNIIPAYAKVEYCTRSLSVKSTLELRKKVIACFESAAVATGCTHKVDAPEAEVYADMRNNVTLADAYADFMTEVFGQKIGRKGLSTASSDFGNVTYRMPAFHPGFHILSDGVNHTAEFTRAAATRDAYERAIKAAKGLAMVGAKFLQDDKFAKEVKRKFDESRHETGDYELALEEARPRRAIEEVDEIWL